MSEELKPSKACFDLLKEYEKLELKAYPDPKTGGAPWTIGYGHTAGVKEGDTCTKKQAEEWLVEDAQFAVDQVLKYVEVPLSQGEFDALVSIVFNVGPGSYERDGIIRLRGGGPSTLLRLLNEGDYDGARNQFLKWVSPGSNVEKGLRRRRKQEVETLWDA